MQKMTKNLPPPSYQTFKMKNQAYFIVKSYLNKYLFEFNSKFHMLITRLQLRLTGLNKNPQQAKKQCFKFFSQL